MEIERLHSMLLEAGIEHEWRDRTPPGFDELKKRDPSVGNWNWGWQVRIWDEDGDSIVSAIEGFGTYGYSDENWPGLFGETHSDLIEIMGLLTPEEAEDSSVVGWLTAENVFARIKHYMEGKKE